MYFLWRSLPKCNKWQKLCITFKHGTIFENTEMECHHYCNMSLIPDDVRIDCTPCNIREARCISRLTWEKATKLQSADPHLIESQWLIPTGKHKVNRSGPRMCVCVCRGGGCCMTGIHVYTSTWGDIHTCWSHSQWSLL